MERQLRMSHARSFFKQHQDQLHSLFQQGFQAQSLQDFIQLSHKKCGMLLKQHHEYRQLCTDQSLAEHLSQLERNMEPAVIFILAYLERNDIQLQTEFLLDNQSHSYTSLNKLSISSHHMLSRPQVLNEFIFWLNQYSCLNSWKFAYLTLLNVLWNSSADDQELQESAATEAESNDNHDCDTLMSRLVSIRDRYKAYFVHKLALKVGQIVANRALDDLIKILKHPLSNSF